MTKIIKSQWQSDGESIHLSMPLAKVDRANRLVSGYATLDNVDTQGDVVLAEASINAFKRARGNLREMHKKDSAVGKIVDFREDEFYDTETQKFYRGVYVTAYISEGAPDTWTKVLDGTLSGFSIGGSIIEATNEFVKDSGQTVRFIKEYDLVELSLVDNPANQLANVFSIQKTADGSVTVKGMVAETEIENVFYCETDTRISASQDDAATCAECGDEMKNIGWFETGDNRAEKVREIVEKFHRANSEGGGNDMSGNVEKSAPVEETPETPRPEDVEAAESAETPAEVEEAPESTPESKQEEEAQAQEEVTDEEEEISKKIEELKDVVKDTLEKSRTETNETVAALEKKIDDLNDSFTQKTSELESKFDSIGQKLETQKAKLASLEKSLEKVNSSGAFKKSAEREPAEQIVQKHETTWDGAFSVDNLL